jgi:hypothetical protein
MPPPRNRAATWTRSGAADQSPGACRYGLSQGVITETVNSLSSFQ